MYLNSSDASSRITGIHAICNYCSSSIESLSRVIGDSSLKDAWFSNLNSTNDLQAACLTSMSVILESKSLLQESDVIFDSKIMALNDLKRNLVDSLASTKRIATSVYLLKMARQPIDSTKHAALNLMQAVIRYTGGWGLQMLFSNPDFLSYLEDASSEHDKLGQAVILHSLFL